MILPLYPQDWPEPWKHAYQERVSIMAESGVLDAERKAEADVKRQAEEEGQQQQGLFSVGSQSC